MKRKSPNIFLGDLARALGELGIKDPATTGLVAAMLGLEITPAQTSPGPLRTPPAPSPAPDGSDEAPDEQEEGGGGSSPTTPEPLRRVVPVEINFSSGEKEEWISEVEPLPPQEENVSVEPPPLEPLFMPQWTRGILSAALATNDEEGPLDVERIAEMLANREIVRRLPTVVSKTLRRGTHLLLDKSRAMMPFVRDQAWLVKEIRRVVGESHVEVFRFAGSPLRGAGVGVRPWPVYQPPLPETPVMLLTDLGICRPATLADRADEAEWAEFGESMQRAGCPLIALVPYGQGRWPVALKRHMTILQWDRNTTAATVSRVLRLPVR